MQSPATTRISPVPSWAPGLAVLGILVWAVSIWWMVATIPDATSSSVPDATADIAALTARLDTLTADLSALQQDRDDLAARVASIGTLPAATAAPLAASLVTSEDGVALDASDGAAPQTSAFFTNGADRYNCRDFASMAEAQEALDVNRPGDPNRIDTNKNNRACEDFKYRTTVVVPPVTP